MHEQLEYYYIVPLSKPEGVNPIQVMNAVYKHSTENIEWLDQAVSEKYQGMIDVFGDYADVQLQGVTTKLTENMADAVFVLKFNANLQRNRLKLSKQKTFENISFWDSFYRSLDDTAHLQRFLPRYNNVSDINDIGD